MSDDQRIRAAQALRELGHEFVRRDLSDDELANVEEQALELLRIMEKAPERLRAHPPHTLADFKMTVPEGDAGEKRQLFADSVVSGSTNPMGLNASLWRDGDVAVLETVLGKAFEGAPDRAHGGVLAALIDESMGLVLAMERVLAYTVQLDISYRAPAPIGELVAARSWLDEKNGRKLSMRCEVRSVGVLVAEAQALFIAVDPGTFLAAN